MNMRVYYLGIVFLSIIFISCNKEESIKIGNIGGNPIDFSVSLSNSLTKTEYGELNGTTNKWPIYWTEGDDVKITNHDQQGEGREGKYDIVIKGEKLSTAGLKPKTVADTVRWIEEKVGVTKKDQFFTIGYPSDKISVVENKVVKISYLTSYNGVPNQIGETGNYKVTSDMKNMPLLGYKIMKNEVDVGTGKSKQVEFNLSPVTTTLEVVVKGKASGGTIAVSGITIVIDNSDKFINEDGSVTYKFNETTNKFEPQEITTTTPPEFIKYAISLDNTYGFIDLGENKTMTFQVFIPGIPYSAEKCKLYVHYGGYTTKKIISDNNLTANVRRKIVCPNTPQTGTNEWITPLDDNIIVSTMSIPGSVNSCSYDQYASAGVDFRLQSFTLEQQLNMGVRAFDLNLYIGYHGSEKKNDGCYTRGRRGGYASNIGLYDFCKKMNDFLSKNPGEFIIAFTDDDGGNYDFATYYRSCLNNVIKDFPNLLAEYKKDLIIKELRGKILIMHTGAGFKKGVSFAQWPENGKSSYDITLNGNEKIRIYSGTMSTTKEDVSTDEARDYAINNMKYHFTNKGWVLTEAVHPTVSHDAASYAQGARDMGEPIQRNTIGIKGSVGIVLIPFVGMRYKSTGVAETNPTYGDIIVESIIRKNYIYKPIYRNN